VLVALLIGLGTGAFTGLVAVLAGGWRSRSGRPDPAR
jgi:hypothetical protein